ncbi:hypothetical protein JOQ06_000463 [Pogonophryne albipinna]|uniref:Krueppel-like factor 7 n=1 Tax=Pogonophryne albipinna TaxID=1090488 RepID=A0AAD6F8A6_9TELE|nr:hypothetical protein JOQ06_000463 [Pogonophryne albipinna]
MDVLANHSIFQELQIVHDTGYFSAMPSLEENWQQASERPLPLTGAFHCFMGVDEKVGSADEREDAFICLMLMVTGIRGRGGGVDGGKGRRKKGSGVE